MGKTAYNITTSEVYIFTTTSTGELWKAGVKVELKTLDEVVSESDS
jgi:hypothetical protein